MRNIKKGESTIEIDYKGKWFFQKTGKINKTKEARTEKD